MASFRGPFYSPRGRLKRANEHISRLHKRVERFFKQAPYHEVVELDADGVTQIHKFKFTKRLPESCTHSAAEALEALRSTLDQIGYAAAVASGKVTPKKTQFPIGDDLPGLENLINRKVSKDLPDEILALFRSFNPYKGGNDTIWALNKLANAKHTSLIPVAMASDATHVRHMEIGGNVSIPVPVFDSEKNEIVFARVGTGSHFKYDLGFMFLVVLGDIDFIARHQAVAVLRAMSAEIKRVLMATEAECHRLGFIKLF
jgi:hypothetical protein